MGRPTKYKPEYARKLIVFFDIEPFEDVVLPHYFDNKTHRVKWKDFKRVANKLPTLRDFAKSIKVPISTVYDWLREKHKSFHKDFAKAFEEAKEIRKDFLIQNALQGLYPPLTFKFIAVNLTDMRDKEVKDVNIGGQEGNPIRIIMFGSKKNDTNTKPKVHKRSTRKAKKRTKRV